MDSKLEFNNCVTCGTPCSKMLAQWLIICTFSCFAMFMWSMVDSFLIVTSITITPFVDQWDAMRPGLWRWALACGCGSKFKAPLNMFFLSVPSKLTEFHHGNLALSNLMWCISPWPGPCFLFEFLVVYTCLCHVFVVVWVKQRRSPPWTQHSFFLIGTWSVLYECTQTDYMNALHGYICDTHFQFLFHFNC